MLNPVAAAQHEGLTEADIRDVCASVTKQISREYMAECSRARETPKELWRVMRETGLFGLGVPEEFGGLGGHLSEVALALDLLGQGGLMPFRFVTTQMARTTLRYHGSEEQKQRYLVPAAAGEITFAFALTEADAGTNSFNIRTYAERQADGDYLINGTKMWITGIHEADYAILITRTSRFDPAVKKSGFSVFIVDPKSAGISLAPIDIGLHMADRSWVVNLDNVRVPAENRIGEEGRGMEALFDCIIPERLLAAGLNVGLSTFVLNKTAEFARIRAPFGEPIGKYQGVQIPMAEALAATEGARALAYQACRKFDAQIDSGMESDMARFLSAEAYLKSADLAMNTHGGAACDMSQDVIPFYLYAKFQSIAPINRNVCLSAIAQREFGFPKSY